MMGQMTQMTQMPWTMQAGAEAGVGEALATLARRRSAVGARAAMLRLMWMAALAVLAALLVDANVALPAGVRLVLLVGVLAVAGCGVWLWWQGGRAEPGAVEQRRLAHELERSQGVPHNRLVNALLLGQAAARCDDLLTRELARRTGERGLTAMRAVDVEAAVAGERWRREGARLWAVAVVWLVVGVIQPGVVGQGLTRLVLPWAAVPAFSLTRLAVTVEPAQPNVGDDVRVHVTVGGLVSEAPPVVVELAAVGRETRRWTMQPAGERQWTHSLHALREPVRFVVEAGTARSRAVSVQPATPPAVDEPAVEPAPSADGDGEATSADAASDMAGQLEALHDLMHQAAAIRDLAEALVDAMTGGDAIDAEARQAMLEALRRDLRQFAEQASVLADQLEAVAALSEAPLHDELMALAAMLRDLSLPGLAHVELSVGEAAGEAAAGVPPGAVRDAAEVDRAALAEGGAGMASSLEGTMSRDQSRLPTLPADGADPTAGGTYDVTMEPGAGLSPQSRAALEQAPPVYRSLVERYFRSLAEEAE